MNMASTKTYILGKAVATAEQMSEYLLSVNPNPSINIPVINFCRLYLYIGALEGVRGDLLFAQSCKETGHFSFKGTVKANQNNYAGLGTTDANTFGAIFPDEATGILAQAQHAKAYEGSSLLYECVDPRYEILAKCGKLGSAKNWEDLGGKWAVPGYDTKKYSSLEEANKAEDSYGYQIVKIYNRIIGKVEESKIPVNNKPLSGRKICIDAGHYGKYNRCPNNSNYYESVVMWNLHLLQKKYLEELGAEVVTTRSNQATDLSLSERGKKSAGCDLFISDHTNATGNGMNETIDYVAVYHLTDDKAVTCDDISKEIGTKLAPVIAGVMGTKQGYKILTRKSSNDKNRDGVLNDNYYGVLHGARMVNVPGLILEHSFHTNTASVNWLLNEGNLDKLAKAEAEVIAEYFSGKQITVNETVDVKIPYRVKVANVSANDVLNIRKEPNSNSDKTGELKWNDPNVYTIVEVKNGWGKLKSGIGWINLKYTTTVI